MTKECCLSQVTGMAKIAGIELSFEQINLYITLRDNMQESNINLDSQNPLNTFRPSTMSDQQLLAEILRVTDEPCLHKIFAAYPKIFPKKESSDD